MAPPKYLQKPTNPLQISYRILGPPKLIARRFNKMVESAKALENKKLNDRTFAKQDPILKQIILERTPKGEELTRADVSDNYPFIGGENTRQLYLDLDTELTDSIKAIAAWHGIDPDLLATQMGMEGPIDAWINENNYDNVHPRSYGDSREYGPAWGLDDFTTDMEQGVLSMPSHINYKPVDYYNEKGRHTKSAYLYTNNNNGWAAGMHGMAAELAYRRKAFQQFYPHITDNNTLNSMASAAYNRGIPGALEWIKRGGNFMGRYPINLHVK